MASMVPTLDVSRGMILEIDGSLHAVLEHQRFLAGKGNSEARVRLKIRDVRSGRTQEKVFSTDDRVAKADVEVRAFQFLYNDGDLFHFMDSQTFEEKLIARGSLGQAGYYLTDGLPVELLMYRDEPLTVQLPITVDLRIKTTEPGFKGDTATGANKKAITETGLEVTVPLFLNSGDVIKVDTRTGEYLSRV